MQEKLNSTSRASLQKSKQRELASR